MHPQKPKRIHVILFIALFAVEIALIALFAASRSSGTELLPELYVAGILICAILIVFLLLTRLGPALLLKSAKDKLKSLKSASGECAAIEPEGMKERLTAALQKDGYALADAEIRQGGDTLRVTVASGSAFSLFYDRMYRYVVVTEDFRKARDFDTLGRYAQSLIDAEGLTDDVRARSGFATVVVLLMPHVPEQVQAAVREEAAIGGPAYVPVACDLTAGKAYFLSGKPVGLLEFRGAQRIIKKYVVDRRKK
jgi:hypothetical protein